MLETLRRRLDRALETVLAVLMAAMVLNVLWQIATRFLFGDPSSYTEELARFALIWLGMLGASYGFGQKVHLAVNLLEERLGHREGGSRRAAGFLEIVVQLCIAAFAVSIFGVGGVRLVELTLRLGQTSAALQIPLGFVYAVLPISAGIVVFYAATDVMRAVAELREAGEDPLAKGEG